MSEIKLLDNYCFVCVQPLRGRKDTVRLSTCDHYFCADCLFNVFTLERIEQEKKKGKDKVDDSEGNNSDEDEKKWLYCPKCLTDTDGAFVQKASYTK